MTNLSEQSGGADEARRAKLKTAATLRAQFNYKVAMDRIDYKLDVEEPAIKAVAQQILELGTVPTFVIEEDNENPSSDA